MLIGNKNDLYDKEDERSVQIHHKMDFFESIENDGILFYGISSKSKIDVDKVFDAILRTFSEKI